MIMKKNYYWYCGDLLDLSQLTEQTLKDTGHTPYLPYIDKHWKATKREVFIYKLSIFVQRIKNKIKQI